MKLLVFYPYIPWPLDRGTHQRTFHLLRELARTHEVDLLALAENGEGMKFKPLFEEFCSRVKFIRFQHPPWPKLFPARLLNPLPTHIGHWTLPGVDDVLTEMLETANYDAVHVCDLVLTQYFMRKHRHIPLVIDRSRVDLQYQLMEHRQMTFPLRARMLRYEGYAKLWFYERSAARRAAMEVVCGPDDKTFIHRNVSSRAPVTVIGNGVDLQFFHPDAAREPRSEEPTILFCGAMDYNPNIDALRWYFNEIHDHLVQRIARLRVLIVGKNPAPEVAAHSRRPNVVVTGSVPDVRPYYRRAWLQIVPLRIGGGTRLKIVESLAMGTPVISTRIGAQGLNLRHTHDALLADTPGDFCRQTARALTNENLRASLERNGLQTACSRFSWISLGRELSDMYEHLS